MKRYQRYFLSVLGGVASGIVAAGLLAIGLAIFDLYLSGHNRPTLSRPWISNPEWGIFLSRADVIFLSGSLIVALAVGILLAALLDRDKQG